MKIYPYPSPEADERIDRIVRRQTEVDETVVDQVRAIMSEVREKGDTALLSYARKFDSPDLSPDTLAVSADEFEEARHQVSSDFRDALAHASRQIRAFHERQVRSSWMVTDRPGALVGQIITPVDAAGVYVPGGQGGSTPLVSSVLMNVIPAVCAGVRRIAMVSPAGRSGRLNPHLLVAAAHVGVDTIYKVGSAWAIAALAYGTESIPSCDVIVGPGNIYVTVAKKLIAGSVGIDMIAGPSEVLVIADRFARPDLVAADLLSQAEHDPMASAILVTDHPQSAADVQQQITEQLSGLPRREVASASMAAYGGIFVVPDLDTAFTLSNRIAPEHLELLISDPFDHIGRIRHAGAVFLGEYSPEPMGDYVAGPNHVLPTSGTARFASALSVDTFTKKTSLVHYSRTAFLEDAPAVLRLAETEGLEAHANAVQVRL